MDSPISLFDQRSLSIQECGQKGRGVVTSAPIPARTIIDISPVLLFPTEEYDKHGRYTQLEHYTYRWQKSMALALGLGSMFNHSKYPNVGFQRDFNNNVIRYSALRDIAAGEELCISYGPNLWFPDMEEEVDDGAHASAHTGRSSQHSQGNSRYRGSGSHSSASDFSDSEDDSADGFLSRLQLDSME
ncbi:hypothetical protein BGZ94_010082 [Podila epigama]|nr:hypothetical protein BGZ94_010082 [Podila epigama]